LAEGESSYHERFDYFVRLILGGRLKGKLSEAREKHFQAKKALARAASLSAETFRDGHQAVNRGPELRRMAVKGKAALEPFEKTIADAVGHCLLDLRAEKAKKECQTAGALADLWLEGEEESNKLMFFLNGKNVGRFFNFQDRHDRPL